MYNFIIILKKLLPFIITLVLWRLSLYFWNPAGILALIPIFYYTFVKPIKFFALFGLLFCFLIDYRCNLPLFWTSLFCLFYAINGFQTYTDISHSEDNDIYFFMIFIGFGMLLLTFSAFTWKNLLNNLWLFAWLSALYTPVTALDKMGKK